MSWHAPAAGILGALTCVIDLVAGCATDAAQAVDTGPFVLMPVDTDDDLAIETTDGLEQGDQRTTVPVNPGTNTWNSEPGGLPAFEYGGGSHPRAGDYARGLGAIREVNYLCCAKRP